MNCDDIYDWPSPLLPSWIFFVFSVRNLICLSNDLETLSVNASGACLVGSILVIIIIILMIIISIICKAALCFGLFCFEKITLKKIQRRASLLLFSWNWSRRVEGPEGVGWLAKGGLMSLLYITYWYESHLRYYNQSNRRLCGSLPRFPSSLLPAPHQWTPVGIQPLPLRSSSPPCFPPLSPPPLLLSSKWGRGCQSWNCIGKGICWLNSMRNYINNKRT